MSAILNDIRYGPYERNVLDAYLADSDEPTPALIMFHGGGYVNGDKRSMFDDAYYAELRDECLAGGISVLSANYRFITEFPFPAPMNDGTRVIQFVRHMASEWRVNPEQIALAGGSAGAHLSLWNAFKGNLAKTDSEDPIERLSSSVCAVIQRNGQISKDQHFYDDLYLGTRLQPNLLLFYGISQPEELERPDVRQLACEASAINFLTSDSPPVFTSFNQAFTPVPIPADTPMGEVIHHPIHGHLLKQRMDGLGIPCTFRHQDDPVQPGEQLRFLQQAFRARRLIGLNGGTDHD